MKIWLDDLRPAPDGFIWIKSYVEAMFFLSIRITQHFLLGDPIDIDEISLDHDLGGEHDGADVLQYLIDNDCVPEITVFHTQNPVGRAEMERMLQRYYERKSE
jgi:hypothetical protein